MASLSGNRIKTTYQGLLKTTDAATLTTSLKAIEDGAGNASALSLSTTTVKVAKLQIGTGPGSLTLDNSITDVLVVSSTGEIKKATLTAADSVTTTTAAGSGSPTITIAQTGGSSKTVTFAPGAGISLSHATDKITITSDLPVPTVTTLSATASPAASNGSVVYALDLQAISADVITLPAATAGANFRFIVKKGMDSATPYIVASGGDYLVGRVTVTQTTGANPPKVQLVTAASTSHTKLLLSQNSTDTGGSVGDVIDIIALDDTVWMVTASLSTTAAPGTLAALTT